MLKKYLLFLASYLCLSALYGQQNRIYPGWATLASGDSLVGDIVFQDTEKSPEVLRFIHPGQVEAKIYKPDQVEAFEVTRHGRFLSRSIKYSNNPHRLKELSENKEVIWEEKQVFLEVIIQGALSLYRYVDDQRKLHYLVKKGAAEMVDLLYIHYTKSQKLHTIARYRTQLKRILYDCADCMALIDKANYDRKSFERIVQAYNKAQGQPPIYILPRKKNRLEPRISFGLSSAQPIIDFTKKQNRTLAPSGELNLELVFPRNYRAWSMINGFGIRSYQMSPLNSETLENLSYFRLNNGVKGKFYNREIQLHASFGLTNSFILKDVPLTRKRERALFYGLGASYKDWGIDLRYERNWGSVFVIGELTKVHTLFFWLTYRFNGDKF